MGIDLQVLALGGAGEHRLDDVLGLRDGGDGGQIDVRRLPREILVKVILRDARIDIAVLDLDGEAVLPVQQNGMKHVASGLDAEEGSDLGRRGNRGQRQDIGAVPVAALGDLLGDVAHLEQGRLGLGGRDEGTDPLDAGQHAFDGEFAQGPVDRHAADAQRLHQFGFRGDAVARLPGAGLDTLADQAFHALVMRYNFPVHSA